MSYEAAVVFLGLFLLGALTACVLLYTGSRHWYELMVKEQEAHLRTRRQLYSVREDAYWWKKCAEEYKDEYERLTGEEASEYGAGRREAC